MPMFMLKKGVAWGCIQTAFAIDEIASM